MFIFCGCAVFGTTQWGNKASTSRQSQGDTTELLSFHFPWTHTHTYTHNFFSCRFPTAACFYPDTLKGRFFTVFTLQVQLALGALQQDGADRVQIVIAAASQRPRPCLCHLQENHSESETGGKRKKNTSGGDGRGTLGLSDANIRSSLLFFLLLRARFHNRARVPASHFSFLSTNTKGRIVCGSRLVVTQQLVLQCGWKAHFYPCNVCRRCDLLFFFLSHLTKNLLKAKYEF